MADTMREALVVEDQPETRAWLVEVAQQAFGEVRVTAGSDIASGLSWLSMHEQSAEPSIALVDLVLPDGSGVDLIRRIVERHPKVLPVVVSIYDDDAHLFEAIAAGAQGYLLKEEGAEALIARLRDIARGEPPLSPSIARRILAHFHKRPPISAPGAQEMLTPRETDVLGLLGRGLRIIDAAQALGLTRHTVAGYVKIIYSKLNISSRAEAALEAKRRGLV